MGANGGLPSVQGGQCKAVPSMSVPDQERSHSLTIKGVDLGPGDRGLTSGSYAD